MSAGGALTPAFWYCAPMILNGAPWSTIALTVVSGVVSVRSAVLEMSVLSGITSGPPGV
jgi:hypothetical protein